MTSISSNRRRSYAPDLTIDTPSLSEIQTDRQTRSMYKTSPDQAAPSSKRTRRSTTVSSNSSEDGDSVRLTKTGRISRALKGQPVHKCDACYKCYTRAEHLRRHQLSHKEQSQNSGTSGSRTHRHTQSLNKASSYHDNGINPSDYASTRASSAFPDFRVEQGHWPYSSTPTTNGFGAQYSSSYDYSQSAFDNTSSIPITTSGPTPTSDYFSQDMPPLPYAYPPIGSNDAWWHPKMNDMYPSRSISPSSLSSFTAAPAWSSGDHHPSTMGFGTPSISAFSSPSISIDKLENTNSQSYPLFDLDEQDNSSVDQDIASLTGLTSDPMGHSTLWMLEDRYSPLFWKYLYPCFPVLHRGSLSVAAHVPNVLKILIVAIGASFSTDPDAGLVAEAMSTSADRVLKRKGPLSSTSRTWDLQITFLAEVYMLFRSRRPVQGLSRRFEALSTLLLCDASITPSNTVEKIASCETPSSTSTIHNEWIDQEIRRRLLLACYVLETQQASLFERHRNLSYSDIPMPCSLSLWNTSSTSEWRILLPFQSSTPTYLFDIPTATTRETDAFTSSIIIAFLTSTTHPLTIPTHLQELITATPTASFTHHTTHLCAHTPLRALLSTAGQSFVLGEKVPSATHFEAQKAEVRDWTSSEDAAKAMFHAVGLLRLAHEMRDREPIGLIWEEWVLYLAGLVCWAVGMWGQGGGLAGYTHDHEGDVEGGMRRFLDRFDGGNEGDLGVSDYEGTMACLAWVLGRLGRGGRGVGGLCGDARFVLGRLVGEML